MGKFDLEKFVTSLLSIEFNEEENERIRRWCEIGDIRAPLKVVLIAFAKALNEQGLEFEDGEIKEIVSDFKIEKGKWYMCIKDYHVDNNPSKEELSFKKGRIYYSFSNSCIKTEQGYGELFSPKTLKEHFRPATEDEFTAYFPRYSKGDILTDGEKFYKILYWDYNERNLAYYYIDYGTCKGAWLAYEADTKLHLTARLELPQQFEAESKETEEISGNNGGISPNCELTEFEKWLKMVVNSYCQRVGEPSDIEIMTDEGARNHGAKLLDIARKQIEKEKVAQLKNTEAYNMGVADGKAEALKDMPKWKKELDIKTAFGISCERYDFIEHQGLYLKVVDLIEKLPKEE